jgi:hypothetical protein
LLNVSYGQGGDFFPAQAAADHDGQKCPVTFSLPASGSKDPGGRLPEPIRKWCQCAICLLS